MTQTVFLSAATYLHYVLTGHCSYLFLFYLQAYTALEKNIIYSLLRVVLLLVWNWESLQIPLHHLLSGNTCFIQRGSLEHYEGRGQVYVNIQLDKEPCRRQHSESTKVVIQFQLHQFGDEVRALSRCFYSVHSMLSTCTFMYMFGFNHSEMVILSIDVEPLLV